jgi:hypothetical protein
VAHHFAGATVDIPGTYQVSTPFGEAGLLARGPLGATVELAHVIAPADVRSAEELGQAYARGLVPLPAEVVVDPTSVAVFDLPAGRAVSLAATIDGDDGRVVIVPGARDLWVATYRSDGSTQSSEDFDDMVRSLELPTG